MKRFRSNVRGQFVIVVALLISLLTLSVTLSVHQVNLHRQQLRYQPVEELVLGITSDLDRCLTHALSKASQKYNQTWPPGSDDLASQEGIGFISNWVRSVIASYAHLGIRMQMEVDPETPDVLFFFYWGNKVGRSYVYTKFDLDIDAYGFKGWVGHSLKLMVLQLSTPILMADGTSLRFHIEDEKGYPIQNLTPESLVINASVSNNTWTLVPTENITSLSYLGGGNYTVGFTPRVYNETLGVRLTVITPEDKIYVSAYYNALELGGWGTLWLAKDKEESMLVPWDDLFIITPPYWNERYSTLPIPNSNNWQWVNISSANTTADIVLAQSVNVTLWITPESDKVKNMTIKLSFTYANETYDNKTYEIGSRTFYNVTQQGWYNFTINTLAINKENWPIYGQAIIPKGSIITLTLIIPPQSGSIHIRYGKNYQSRIELY